MVPVLERFNKMVMPEPNTGCHLWIGALFTNGYGVFRISKMNKKAHRMSYELNVGSIPNGLIVCHKCDVPSCVNPDHLFLGTHKDNVQDMINKGRKSSVKGESHGSCRLNESEVLNIRKLSDIWIYENIANLFGISKQHVSDIVNRKKWRHI